MQEPIACSGRWPVPRVADVPRPGDLIAEGHPICTVFAVGRSIESCNHALEDAAQRLYYEVRVSPGSHG
jgi:predicted ATP-grasp superfamily ATP-dependent carboligase